VGALPGRIIMKKEIFKQRKEKLRSNPGWNDLLSSEQYFWWFDNLKQSDLKLEKLINKLTYKEYQEIVNKNTIKKILKGEVLL
jgi:hypothetical protein